MKQENIPIEQQILQQYRTVAIIGLSPDPERDSNRVGRYLSVHGYTIIPVNPTVTEILDRKSYPNLLSIPQPVDIVDIFRASDKVIPIVEEAIKIKAKVIWMQEGIINEDAACMARAAGLLVVMDRCMRKMHANFFHEYGLGFFEKPD